MMKKGMMQRDDTYLTTCGAMTLQGPHQVAKKSTTATPSSHMAESHSAWVVMLWTPILVVVVVKRREKSWCWVRVVVGVLLKRVVVSSVRRKAEDADIYVDVVWWEGREEDW